MIVAALRQVTHTFEVAQRQEGAERLGEQYHVLQERYAELHDRLAALLDPGPGEDSLHRVK